MYETIRDGYWYDPAIWKGGLIPPSDAFNIVIKHDVIFGHPPADEPPEPDAVVPAHELGGEGGTA